MKRKILENCLDIASKNNTPDKHPEWKHYHHFSFFIQSGKILAWNTNKRSHPQTVLGYDERSKLHSETAAYFTAKGILDYNESFEVVNIRLTNTGRIAMSKPCRCCYGLLQKSGCKRIWFTTDIGKFACINF